MRGKQGITAGGFADFRNIPAYAGKTSRGLLVAHMATEHPRVCGENANQLSYAKTCTGTSPRMRGKRGILRRGWKVFRNIPAYAGKTFGRKQPKKNTPEHPRVCGENSLKDKLFAWNEGTSPRMRGKPRPCHLRLHNIRNIPAYAGKTWRRSFHRWTGAEHPRVCGENPVAYAMSISDTGTSPRMRGKLV